MTFPSFDAVRDQIVSDDNPARDEGEMDYERCASLHNAIVEHGWTAMGRSLDELARTTLWESDAAGWEANVGRLHPSMIEFMKRAYNTELPDTVSVYSSEPRDYAFFYYLKGLVWPQGYTYHDFEWLGEFPGHYMTLYTPNDWLGSHPQGLIYNQETHECLINFINTDFCPEFKALPWQRLETVLSVYIDMIECGKAVCLHNDVLERGDYNYVQLSGETEKRWVLIEDIPGALSTDPVTGVERTSSGMFGPWVVRMYTEEILDNCVSVWDKLVEAIEEAMPSTVARGEPHYGLADDELLDRAMVTDDFARKLLLRARRPRFIHIAPGLRMPLMDEFAEQPFKGSLEALQKTGTETGRLLSKCTMPILLFRGDDICDTSEDFMHPYSSAGTVPSGLYLDGGWAKVEKDAFTDAVHLLLPFSLGREDTWAQTGNGIAIDRRHDTLYQIGENPYVQYHGISLLAVLQNFYAHVCTGHWSVDEGGVSGTIEKFREAETEEHCDKYVIPMGPGAYW